MKASKNLKSVSKKKNVVWEPTQITISQKFMQVDCGRNSTSAVTYDGKAYIWGFLAAKDMQDHQFVPRRIEKLYEKDLFVGQIASGLLHTACLVDTKLSHVISELILSCNGNESMKIAHIKELLSGIDQNMVKPVQDRALQKLYEQSDLPIIEVDRYVVSFSVLKQSDSVRFLKVTNMTDRPLEVPV